MSFTADEIEKIKHVKGLIHQDVSNALTILPTKLAHLTDEHNDLMMFIRTYFVVTGGISASLFHREAPKDIDLYYAGTIHFDTFYDLMERFFIKTDGKFHPFVKDINPTYMIGDVAGKCITANAVTLYNNIQLIRLSSAIESRRVFDFIHCQPMYDWEQYHISRAQYDSIANKKLIPNNTKSKPALNRIEKFRLRGWDITEAKKLL